MTSDEYAILTSHELRSELKANAKDARCVPTGFDSLDKHIHGIYGGEVTVLTGPTKNGKTLFAATVTNNLCTAERKENCLWFPYEVSGLRFLELYGDPLPLFYLPRKLNEAAGHKGKAAESMGMTAKTLRQKLRDCGLGHLIRRNEEEA